MKELIRHIIKEETSRKTKLLKMVDSIGVLNTADVVGGVEKLFDILGNEFFSDNLS